ncbi:hypothetical protein [Massilia glaciei]|uniref:hypothetical protein n=1 Tax=Massilia glaciei TaxID=1524097 RepID=UPI0015E8191D|nr:hypothetical protein [Massilia glaciei]
MMTARPSMLLNASSESAVRASRVTSAMQTTRPADRSSISAGPNAAIAPCAPATQGRPGLRHAWRMVNAPAAASISV